MGVLSVPLTFVGYVLIYAASANHGKFATSPWTSLFQDAYGTPDTPPAASHNVPGGGTAPNAPGTPLNSLGFATNDPAYRLRGPQR